MLDDDTSLKDFVKALCSSQQLLLDVGSPPAMLWSPVY